MDKAILRAEADHGLSFEVSMLPFQLDPALPSTSIDKVTYLAARLGGVAVLDQVLPSLQASFRSEGLPELKRDGQTGNTLAAHRLLAHAKEAHGLPTQAALKDALFVQYFHHGRSVSERQVLLEAASIAGMEAGGAARVIDDDEAYRAQVVDEVARARRDGVLSVPHFRIADRPGFSDSEADFLAIFAALAASA